MTSRLLPLNLRYGPFFLEIDPKHIGQFLKKFNKESISIPRIPFIDCLNTKSSAGKELLSLGVKNKALKVIILTDKLSVTEKDKEEEPKSIRYTPEKLNDALSEECIGFIKDSDAIYRIHELTFGYDFWKAEEILKAVLPENLLDDVPTSFTKAGHLAHLNLRDEYKPYDTVIGQVILDKNPTITTVVDKVDTVGNKFRTFKMKVIAGEPNFMVTQRESGCDFTFDFSKVYWNSRLSTEHGRLIKGFKPGTAICDVMAGVGPFAIPAGKKECFVFANDLNPESYKYLKQNIQSNKTSSSVIPFNMDGAQLIKDSPKILMDYVKEHPTIRTVSHPNGHAKRRKVSELKVPHFFSEYAMNLPGSIHIPYNSQAFKSVTASLIDYADTFLAIIRKHVDAEGHMSEQFNKYSGYLEGAEDLTWSYGSFWSSLRWRSKALELMSS